jgi:hypothetical protein
MNTHSIFSQHDQKAAFSIVTAVKTSNLAILFQTDSVAYTTSCPMGEVISPGGKRQGRETEHSSPTGTKVKKM